MDSKEAILKEQTERWGEISRKFGANLNGTQRKESQSLQASFLNLI